MNRILVTGATGNIGHSVVHYLNELQTDQEICIAARNIDRAKSTFKTETAVIYRHFDFENPDTYTEAFNQIGILFLLRPPHISAIDKVFRPLLTSARDNGIRKVVFLSVQGAEKSNVIPHNKIEKLIQELGFNFIFIRPSYFMQNLTTTLLPEIKNKRSITLPSGTAKFNWVDVKNIGEVTAKLISNFEIHQNKAFDITGTENTNFTGVARLIADLTGENIVFKSINPIRFYFQKKKEGLNSDYALVMTFLHFLPRLQNEPHISDNYQKLVGKKPTTLKEFVLREIDIFK